MTGGSKASLAVLVLSLLLTASCVDEGPETERAEIGEVAVAEVATHVLLLPDDSGDELAPSSRLAFGDINGDGKEDLVIGVPGADGPNRRVDGGQVYVLIGGDIPQKGDVSLAAAMIIHGATAGDNLGYSVATGDLNGDGFDDVMVGAIGSNGVPEVRTDMGEVFVFFGTEELESERDTLAGEFDLLLQPAEGFSRLGSSLAAGDVNGDGIDDLVAGAPFAGRQDGTPPGGPRTTTGEVYLVFGDNELAEEVKVGDGDQDVRMASSGEFDQFGQSVSIGDLNGDGLRDVLVGAPGLDGDSGLEDVGALLAFYGHPELPDVLRDGDADIRVSGGDPGSRTGAAVSLGGEDGRAVFVAAPTLGTASRPGSGFLFSVSSLDGSVSVGSSEGDSYIGSIAGGFFPASLSSPREETGGVIAAGSPGARGGRGAVYILPPAEGQVDLLDPPGELMTFLGEDGDHLGAAVAFGNVQSRDGVDLAMLASRSLGGAMVYVVEL